MKEIYKSVIKNVPNYKQFLTLEEMEDSSKRLSKEYSDCVELLEIGRTRSGYPINCLKIGEGSSNALMFGCPHPNEPIGTMLIEYFSEELAKNKALRDELDYTWYIIKVWDADGYRLNRGWIKSTYSIRNYARNFYRPPSDLQVEWTFPIDYKDYHFHNTLPESEAMRKLISQIKPKFTYSLHNSGFGGAYWYITREVDECIYEKLYRAAKEHGVPVHKGTPESSSLKEFSQAVYKADGIDSTYEYYLDNGVEDVASKLKSGNCSDQFSEEHYNTFTLLTELPYFYDLRISDTSLSDYTRCQAYIEMLDYSDKLNGEIKNILNKIKPLSNINNPFLRALNDFCDSVHTQAQRNEVLSQKKYNKQATVAEKFDCLTVAKFYKLLTLGMLVRAHESEFDSMLEMDYETERYEILNKTFEQSKRMFDQLAEHLESVLDYEVISIKKLISIQLQCGLVIADYINKQ